MLWRSIMCQKVGDIQETTYRKGNMRDEYNGTVWSQMIVKNSFYILKIYGKRETGFLTRITLQAESFTYVRKSENFWKNKFAYLRL